MYAACVELVGKPDLRLESLAILLLQEALA